LRTEPQVETRILPDLEALSHEGGIVFARIAREAISGRGRFAVALSGGETPRRLYALLGSPLFQDEINWNGAHFFWADERCVPPEREESNFKWAWDLFLSKTPVPASNIHRIRGEEDPEKEAKRYETELRLFFGSEGPPRFDLVLLGVGDDGHTASLFPDSNAVEERTRLVLPVFLEEPKKNRITLTLPVLNHASKILFLVSGSSKAEVVKRILAREKSAEKLPAALVKPYQGSVLWLIDEAASTKWLETDAGRLYT